MRLTFAFALLVSSSLFAPVALAQDASRMDLLEGEVRQLTRQVEELTFLVKSMKRQMEQRQQTGAVEPDVPAEPRRKLNQIADAKPSLEPGEGIEVIEETSIASKPTPAAPEEIVGSTEVPREQAGLAPGVKVLGSMESRTRTDDSSFQGQVLVPLGSENEQAVQALQSSDGSIEQVALAPQTPQALFEQSNEALLRRQFPKAEEGFRKLLESYPDHSLAGSAQYWLGETYYAQGDYRSAAQNFLVGYQKYPKSRRAPDSLVKLGVSLAKLGERDKACSALGSVSGEYPKAAEAKKRAVAELKRVGC